MKYFRFVSNNKYTSTQDVSKWYDASKTSVGFIQVLLEVISQHSYNINIEYKED